MPQGKSCLQETVSENSLCSETGCRLNGPLMVASCEGSMSAWLGINIAGLKADWMQILSCVILLCDCSVIMEKYYMFNCAKKSDALGACRSKGSRLQDFRWLQEQKL